MYSSNCLCIIACGKNKKSEASKACDLYTGTSFIVRSKWANNNFENWCILSAKHSILLPNKVIEPYDVNMKDLSKEERELIFTKGVEIIKSQFPSCNCFYLILPSPYDEFAEYLKPLGEVIFPLAGMQGRSALHYMITGNSNTVDVDEVIAKVTSNLVSGKGYPKKYILSLIKEILPEYSPTYFNRIVNSSTIDGTGDKGLRFRRIWEIHDGLYYLADTYNGYNPISGIRKLF